jgi:hypothetical protein
VTITTFSSREFNQDTSRAKKATARGPVFIAGGQPAYVLLSIEEYQRWREVAPALSTNYGWPPGATPVLVLEAQRGGIPGFPGAPGMGVLSRG